jgi:hypothetical protein
MSSSSDIEKLFDHFGGDASAYQEIGRENEARSARTRWPLLVTLDLTQPTIPAIGQRREAKPQALAAEAPVAVDRQDTTPKDAASVTRARAPLFTRSHRRDIPPVAVAAPATAPKGASRFGELESKNDATSQAAGGAARVEGVAPVAAQAAPAVASVQTAPVASAPQAVQAAAIPLRPPVMQTASSTAPSWAQTSAPARAYTTTTAPIAPTAPAAPAASTQPASILGKLFAPGPASAPTPPQAAATSGESAPLQAVFDRLRGAPAQPAAAPAGAARAATPATSNSWLINGPRRS